MSWSGDGSGKLSPCARVCVEAMISLGKMENQEKTWGSLFCTPPGRAIGTPALRVVRVANSGAGTATMAVKGDNLKHIGSLRVVVFEQVSEAMSGAVGPPEQARVTLLRYCQCKSCIYRTACQPRQQGIYPGAVTGIASLSGIHPGDVCLTWKVMIIQIYML